MNLDDHEQNSSCLVAVFDGVGQPLALREIKIPQLQDGDVRVRITCCTICGSDLHTFNGHRPGPTPSILGHEIIGVVEEIGGSEGRDVDGNPVVLGDRITWSVAASCHTCQRCKAGLPQKCESLFKYGHEQLTTGGGPAGGLAQVCLLRPGTAIVPVPDSVPDSVLCPANCATATVAAAVRTAGSLEDKRILIFGAGMLGLTATAFAVTHRAKEICVCDIDESRFERAKQFGATRTAKLPPETKFDVVFEMSGSPDAVELAINSTAIGGTIVLVGSVFTSRSVAVDPERVVRRLLSIHGVHNYHPADLQTAVHFLHEHHNSFPFAELVEKEFPLSAANEAFEYAIQNRPVRIAIVP